jgi:hypothetical protein
MKTTERTLVWLKSCGIPREKLEHRIPGYNPDTSDASWRRGGKTKDAWGCIDIEALSDHYPQSEAACVWWVQACSSGELNDHIEKIEEVPHIRDLLARGRVLIFAWRKLKGKGRRQWWPRIIELFDDDPDDELVYEEWESEQIEGMLLRNDAPSR